MDTIDNAQASKEINKTDMPLPVLLIYHGSKADIGTGQNRDYIFY